MNFRMPHEVRRVSGPTRWTSVTDYAITSLTAVQADLVLLAAPTRLCRRSTDELVTDHEDLDVLDCVGPGVSSASQLSTRAICSRTALTPLSARHLMVNAIVGVRSAGSPCCGLGGDLVGRRLAPECASRRNRSMYSG